MEIKFENRYIVTDEMLSEYVYKVLCRRIQRMSIAIFILSLIMLLFTVSDGDGVLSAVFGVCLVIAVTELLAVPPAMIRQLKENGRRIHNGKSYESVILFGDKISITEGTFSLTVEYSQIIKIYYLKHSCALMFGKSNGILLSLNGFTAGSFEEFQEFIEQKCPDAK